jgi:hypothetical protein
MSAFFELATSEKASTDAHAKQLIWAAQGGTATVRASLDPWLNGLGTGTVSPQAIDLVRIALAALIADRRTPRPTTWGREIRLRVHAVEPPRWTDAVSSVTELLQFLSGDVWDLEIVSDISSRPDRQESADDGATYKSTALFSGGLDSFCGALISRSNDESESYISHRDNPTVAASQNRATDWLRANVDDAFSPHAVTLAQAQQTIEGTSRTRSFLFLALGIASAEARGATTLVVPENGFTSLNPPLRADRTGPLSTRSTHPYSFALLNLIREQAGLGVEVQNPYSWLTKGELVAKAATTNAAASAGMATTLSCAKLDGRLYKGGNQNWNCGLCVACIVRRAAISAAGLTDETPYVATRVRKATLQKLIERRRSDIQAVRRALAEGTDEDILISSAEFPLDFDIDEALGLWQRALKEIALVPLP